MTDLWTIRPSTALATTAQNGAGNSPEEVPLETELLNEDGAEGAETASGFFDFLRQAIEQFGIDDLVLAVVAQVLAVLVGALVAEELHRRRDRRPRRTNPGDVDGRGNPNLVQRPAPRRGYRTPLVQPSGSYGAPLPEGLAESMRFCGRVPLERSRHRRRVVEFWRAARLALLPVKTVAKSEFTTTDWRFRPLEVTELAEGHPYCGGFECLLRLHASENRWHLKRSLQVGRPRARARRLIVIASARDRFEPMSWVRCLVVNADTMSLPKGSPGHAVLRSAQPSPTEGPPVYRSRRKDVSEDAVWLTVPTSTYRNPAPSWGESTESHGQQTSVAVGSVPRDCGDVDNESYVRRWVRSYRWATIWLWAMLGPGTWLMLWLISLPPPPTEHDYAQTDDIATVLAVHGVVYVIIAIAALAKLAIESTRAFCWRRRENQTRRNDQPHRAWTGGTDECLIMGDLLRRGPNLRPRQWREHCVAAVQHPE